MSFLQFTGENKLEDGRYLYEMKDKNNQLRYEEYDKFINIPSPIVVNNFIEVFAKAPEITKSMLNDVIYPETKEILDLEFIPTEMPGIITEYPLQVKLYCLDSLSADILCKCKLRNGREQNQEKNEIKDEEEPKFDEINIGEKDNDELEKELGNYINEEKGAIDEIYSDDENKKKNKKDKKSNKNKKSKKDKKEKDKKKEGKTIIIDLEMQIGYNSYNTKTFIKYAKRLNFKYDDKIIVLSLVFRGFQNPKKNKGFVISLDQKVLNEYKIIKTFDDYIIYQIDLDYCLHLISKKNQKLWILNESQTMNDDSKEWIKYLTLPIWCKSTTQYYYEFPPINKEFFNNKYVYEAFNILSKQEELTYFKHAENQEFQANTVNYYSKIYKENKDKDEVIKEKNKEIKKLKDEIQKLKIKNSNSKSKDKKNKPNNKKIKYVGKVRKTNISYISSGEEED